jgi:uncharacterized protein (TIGR03437 family)
VAKWDDRWRASTVNKALSLAAKLPHWTAMGSLKLPIVAAILTSPAWCQNPGIIYSEIVPVLRQGNTASGFVNAIARDSAGNIYLSGETESSTLPVTPGAPQTTLTGAICTDGIYNPFIPPETHPCPEPFLVEYDPKGNVAFGTYLNGVTGLAVDSTGNVYSTGSIAVDPPAPAGNAATVITKFNPKTGTTAYSLPIIGVSGGLLMTIDAQGNLYFAGTAADNFTPTPGALNGAGKIVVGKVNPAGTQVLYAARFGGTATLLGDLVASIAVDSAGSIYLTGGTGSKDFPVTPGAFQTQPPNRTEWAFVTKLNPSGSALAYSSLLGGSTLESGSQIRVDAEAEAYVLGISASPDFPITNGAFQTRNTAIGKTGFLAKFTADGSGLIFATYIAGAFGFNSTTQPIFVSGAMDIDPAGDVFVTGQSGSGFPVTAGATQSCPGGGAWDVFVAEFTPTGTLLRSTYFGGSGLESANAIVANADGTVTISGPTMSADFPVTIGTPPSINYFLARLQIADPSRPDHPCLTLLLENAASRIQKPIAPGELVTLTGNHFGPDVGVAATPDANGNLPTELAGVLVLFDGVPVPLLYVQSQQINAQAPFELAGKQSTNVQVVYQGVSSQIAPITVREASPDFFQTQSANQGVIFNQDGSPNSPSNPAPVGSVVWILGTGGGLYSPPLPTGSIAPLSPLSHLVLTPRVLVDDGIKAEVRYAGSSPTAPSGVFQINFVVPPVGSYPTTHTVDVGFDGITTNPLQTVSIAIK